MVVVVLLSVVALVDARYVVSDDNGDHDIGDLGDFLEVAGLGREYVEPLESEGLDLMDIKEATDEDLEAVGIKKVMHRSRFLRHAKKLHEVAGDAPSSQKPPPPQQPKQPGKEKTQKQTAANAPRAGTTDAELAAAVEREDVDGVEAALAAGADVDVMMTGDDGDMLTALMYSSLLGLEDIASVLLKNGADVNVGMAKANFTPLHGAAFQGRPGVIKLLLDAGADPLHRHGDGFIPMHRACWGSSPKHTESVLVFLEHGVDVSIDAEDPDQKAAQGNRLTPLDMSEMNPMTVGLIQEWQRSGRKPMGSISDWGEGADDVGDATAKQDL